jgi:hypothetical protein
VSEYRVYATRWDDPSPIEEIPGRDLEFSFPKSDHGEASFTATVGPGGSAWRAAVGLPMSGILIARDGVPWWQGWVTDDRQSGPRSFQFQAREWGHFFEEKVKAAAWVYAAGTDDHHIFTDLIERAQDDPRYDVQITLPTNAGTTTSQLTIQAWEQRTVGQVFREIGNKANGPEWYFGTSGTLDNPIRQLVLGARLGHTTAQTVLEYVEDTEDYQAPGDPPVMTLLGDLFPGSAPLQVVRRVGGNVIALSRTKSVANAATLAYAADDGQEGAQKRATATATTLLNAGWPGMARFGSYSNQTQASLQRHANADLAASAGIPTGYSLVTLDGDPDWTSVPRGSTVRVLLDTDIYGGERPVGGPDGFEARLLDMVVRVPNEGPAQVEWRIPEVLEI